VARGAGVRARLGLCLGNQTVTGGEPDAYLTDRAARAGLDEWRRLTGPLLVTETGGRLRQSHLSDLVRRSPEAAGIPGWEQISPHSLRHSAITFALDAGVPLRDVQDYVRHKDPRTTRRYDHSRDSLDRNAAYTVAAYLARRLSRASRRAAATPSPDATPSSVNVIALAGRSAPCS
jgi:integrase